MKKLIADYTEYNLWANTRICSFCTQVDEALLDKKFDSSFPTIKLTLQHIWAAENIYYNRFHGLPTNNLDAEVFKGDFNALQEGILAQSGKLREFYHSLTDEKIEQLIKYTNTAGAEISLPLSEIMLHCVNHSTYHRGQLINLLRRVGFKDFISNDLITYYLEREN